VALLKDIMPHVARVAIPFNVATSPYADFYLNYFKSTASPLGVEVIAGVEPSDLPVQFDLAVNLNTAKALGLTVPQTLLATADEVIQ